MTEKKPIAPKRSATNKISHVSLRGEGRTKYEKQMAAATTVSGAYDRHMRLDKRNPMLERFAPPSVIGNHTKDGNIWALPMLGHFSALAASTCCAGL
ncbi:MAG TPA: hypothetical protein VF992_08995 [Thermoplasmata archaeon]